MRYKLKAFTLTELLVALGIIGAIAALSIPSLMNAINNRMMATQIKSNVTAIQQLISDQLVLHKTKTLEDTDIASATAFYSNFDFATACSAKNKCWGDEYKTISGPLVTFETLNTSAGIKLKNGTSIQYLTPEDTHKDKLAKIYIDINGADFPNIAGRDLYAFYITKDARIQGTHSPSPTPCDAATECFQALMQNNWTMPENNEYYVK